MVWHAYVKPMDQRLIEQLKVPLMNNQTSQQNKAMDARERLPAVWFSQHRQACCRRPNKHLQTHRTPPQREAEPSCWGHLHDTSALKEYKCIFFYKGFILVFKSLYKLQIIHLLYMFKYFLLCLIHVNKINYKTLISHL